MQSGLGLTSNDYSVCERATGERWNQIEAADEGDFAQKQGASYLIRASVSNRVAHTKSPQQQRCLLNVPARNLGFETKIKKN
jgi:hypothetical protein